MITDPVYIKEAANMHPYNQVGCTGEIIVDEVEKYLKKSWLIKMYLVNIKYMKQSSASISNLIK